MSEWDVARLQRLIDDRTSESLLLDYKASGALDKGAATEISKDVSAFANAAGGTIIYGIEEDPNNRHLPLRIDEGTDPKRIRREWIEDVVKNIRPRIDGLLIHPVPLANGNFAYVVEIPQGMTAHQATDHRYYRRLNFSREPMFDHEIRDVMRRADGPRIEAKFDYVRILTSGTLHKYQLEIELTNAGTRRARDFKLQFLFPRGIEIEPSSTMQPIELVRIQGVPLEFDRYVVILKDSFVLFPQDTWKLADNNLWLGYRVDHKSHAIADHADAAIHWWLWADDAQPQAGIVPFSDLSEF